MFKWTQVIFRASPLLPKFTFFTGMNVRTRFSFDTFPIITICFSTRCFRMVIETFFPSTTESQIIIFTFYCTETLARTVKSSGDVVFVPAFSGLYAPHWCNEWSPTGRRSTGHRSNRWYIKCSWLTLKDPQRAESLSLMTSRNTIAALRHTFSLGSKWGLLLFWPDWPFAWHITRSFTIIITHGKEKWSNN